MLNEPSHTISQIVLIDFPDVSLLSTVLVPVVAKRYHLVVDVVELSIEAVVPLNRIVSINDLYPTAVCLDYISDVVE